MDPYKLTRELEIDQFQAELTSAFDSAARRLGARAELRWEDTSEACALAVTYRLRHRHRMVGFVMMGFFTLAALAFTLDMLARVNGVAVPQLFLVSALCVSVGALIKTRRERMAIPTVDQILAGVVEDLSPRYEVVLRRDGNNLSVYWSHTS